MRKILCLALAVIMLMAGSVYALSLGDLASSGNETENESATEAPENALSSQPDDSLYFVLKLDDTARFLKWAFSRENINIFMPLILSSDDSNEIMGMVEMISSFAENTPLKSVAIASGMTKGGAKSQTPFLQMAFTVNPEAKLFADKIASGTAQASDFAKIILGGNSPLVSMAETMIKVERDGDMFRINNVLFVKTEGDMIILGLSSGETNNAVNALKGSGARLFGEIQRKFSTKDFVIIHVDPETASLLAENADEEEFDLKEYFDRPLNVEFAFERLSDKFRMSTGLNLIDSLKKEFADKIRKNMADIEPVKGGNLDPTNLGSKSPLLALGGYLNLPAIRDTEELESFWQLLVKQARNRFGITEEELSGLFKGAFSFAANDSVTVEGFKIPALYISQAGQKGFAAKVFEKLAKSPHFHKVQDGILQVDSSLSPVSCLIQDRGETLGIDFAELASLKGDPAAVKPSLEALMKAPAIASFWLDFAGIQSWITDDENGVMMMLGPLATFGGYGKQFQAFRDVLGAELSVPSMSVKFDSPEVWHTEFDIAEINPENGLFAKLIKLYRDLKD